MTAINVLPRALERVLRSDSLSFGAWLTAGLSCAPAERRSAEAAVRLIYEALQRPRPRDYVWGRSPGEMLARYLADGAPPSLRRLVVEPDVSEDELSSFGARDTIWWLVWHCVGRHVFARLEREGGRGIVDSAWYGQFDVPALARLGPESGPAASYVMLAECAGPVLATPDTCYLSDRPVVLHRDAWGHLHRDDGPALAYRDGWSIHAWHGEVVPARLLEPAGRIMVADVLAAHNAELRRHLMERMGYQRYLEESGARRIQADRHGELYRIDFPGEEPVLVVHVVNSTPEPDGTRRRYTLRVPPTVRTAREAVAWTFGVSAKDYRPQVES